MMKQLHLLMLTELGLKATLEDLINHWETRVLSIAFDLQVDDNGQGCDLSRVSSGFGLQGMAERVKLLGGEFELQSHPGKGMQIMALIPII